MTSLHYSNDRTSREYLIANVIGLGKVVRTVLWDRHHPNGSEIHCISDTGIVTIYNELTGKMVTRLIARPEQIRRYYEHTKTKVTCPQYLIDLAIEHKKLGYNNY